MILPQQSVHPPSRKKVFVSAFLADHSQSPVSPQTTVTLYFAPDCCLCEDAREILLKLQTRHSFTLFEQDITGDKELHLRYLERIPVIAVSGEEICEYFVEEERVIAKLYSEASQPAEEETT